jgi:hypothetical protein
MMTEFVNHRSEATEATMEAHQERQQAQTL